MICKKDDVRDLIVNNYISACTGNTFGTDCSGTCACNETNAVDSSQTCNHVTGDCECKEGWTGDCNESKYYFCQLYNKLITLFDTFDPTCTFIYNYVFMCSTHCCEERK